jgi:hypothetical protein
MRYCRESGRKEWTPVRAGCSKDAAEAFAQRLEENGAAAWDRVIEVRNDASSPTEVFDVFCERRIDWIAMHADMR